jgi:hypothetical protein
MSPRRNETHIAGGETVSNKSDLILKALGVAFLGSFLGLFTVYFLHVFTIGFFFDLVSFYQGIGLLATLLINYGIAFAVMFVGVLLGLKNEEN